jgi:hypothetical protein
MGVVDVANHNTVDFRVKKKAFEIPLPHSAGTNETQADLIVRAWFAGANGADEWKGDTS